MLNQVLKYFNKYYKLCIDYLNMVKKSSNIMFLLNKFNLNLLYYLYYITKY